MDNLCPICNEPATMSCKCFRCDSVCKNGHEWHTCTVHRVTVLGGSDHSTSTMTCTCGTSTKDLLEAVTKLGKCKDGTDNHDYELIRSGIRGMFAMIGGPKKFKCALCGKEKTE